MILDQEYILTLDNTNLPLSLNDVNWHLKLSLTDLDDTYLSLLIKAVQKYGEQFTRREFLTKTFTLYLKNWSYQIELRKSSLVEIDSVNYIDNDGITQIVDSSDYFSLPSTQYSTLIFNEDYEYPTLNSNNPYPIIIQFKAGYGLTEASIPSEIKTAMLHHLARVYAQRGDCFSTSVGISNETIVIKALPVESRLIYSIYRISDIRI